MNSCGRGKGFGIAFGGLRGERGGGFGCRGGRASVGHREGISLGRCHHPPTTVVADGLPPARLTVARLEDTNCPFPGRPLTLGRCRASSKTPRGGQHKEVWADWGNGPRIDPGMGPSDSGQCKSVDRAKPVVAGCCCWSVLQICALYKGWAKADWARIPREERQKQQTLMALGNSFDTR